MSVSERLQVGLDDGFDGGAAAWVLDLAGCVATARSEANALGALPDRVRAFRAWAGEGGESTEFEVVERVGTRVLDDGYEVNATFQADLAPLVANDVMTAQRRIGKAHQRLIDAAFAMPGSSLRSAGHDDEEMLRHVLRAGIWLSTRIESDQKAIRYPPEEVSIGERVRDGFPFIDWYVARPADGDGVRRRTDSRGEEWTVRKIVRRLIHHAIDHAEQLERGEVRA